MRRYLLPALMTLGLFATQPSAVAAQNGIASGFATFGDAGSISIEAVGFASGTVVGTVTYRSIPGPGTVIQLDCMSFIPGGNVTTVGGDLYASGVESASGQRYYLRITDQFGVPGRFGAFVVVSTEAGTEEIQCHAEDLRGEPIHSGDFLFVQPA